MGSARVWTCQTNIYAAACLWKWDFWNISPRLASSTAELHRYYPKLQTQLSVNRVLRSVFMVCWHLERLSSQQGRAFTSRWVRKSTQQCALGPYVGMVGCVGDKCKNSLWHSGRVSEGDEQHLVGHCVLVGELVFARQILVHRWNDLQDVVVRGQSCSGNNNNISQT